METVPGPFADPVILPRIAAVVSIVAAAGVVLLIARATLVRRREADGGVLFPAARDSFVYLLLALLTRFAIQQHRSRLQILVLLAAVTAVEIVRLRPGTVPKRGVTWLGGSAAVCLGVVMAKWALEPGALSEAWDRLRVVAAL